MKKLLFFSLIGVMHTFASAQHIREQDIIYSRYIVREIDLRHECNKRIFGDNALLPAILLDALKHGAKAFSDADHTQHISYEQVQAKLQVLSVEDSCAHFFHTPLELYLLELTEQFIFDKQTSEFRFIPATLTLFIPAEVSNKGIMEPLVVFSFEECTRIFRNDLRAFSAATKFGQFPVNFNEQFILRSYVSTIVKIGNKDDLYFDQQYADPYTAFMAMKKEEQFLQEMMYTTYNTPVASHTTIRYAHRRNRYWRF